VQIQRQVLEVLEALDRLGSFCVPPTPDSATATATATATASAIVDPPPPAMMDQSAGTYVSERQLFDFVTAGQDVALLLAAMLRVDSVDAESRKESYPAPQKNGSTNDVEVTIKYIHSTILYFEL
jgi:hypothetical protein